MFYTQSYNSVPIKGKYKNLNYLPDCFDIRLCIKLSWTKPCVAMGILLNRVLLNLIFQGFLFFNVIVLVGHRMIKA